MILKYFLIFLFKIFVENNIGNKDVTIINKLKLIGCGVAITNMSNFKSVEYQEN